MDRIANRIVALRGWQRLVLAVGAGAASSLALAPFGLFPILWITFPVFVWLIDSVPSIRDAGTVRALVAGAVVGWAFGFGYFLGGLWWIGAAFLVDADEFVWALPLAVVLLPAGLAIFWAAASAAARLVWLDRWPRILILAVGLSSAEWLRGHVLTGFPWNAVGYALTPNPVMMQTASIIGIWGLTLVAVVVFAAPAVLGGSADHSRARYGFVAFSVGLFLVHVGFGMVRLSGAEEGPPTDLTLRIVQPMLDQDEKWDVAQEDAVFGRYLRLSVVELDGQTIDDVDVLVWPESAFPFLLTERPERLAAIAELLPSGAVLITGAARAEPGHGDQPPRVFNSVFLIADDGEIVGVYDKVRLVPFGEFLPLLDLLSGFGLRQLVALPGGFAPGSKRHALTLENGPAFGPLICYEITFPGAVIGAGPRPGWLLNLTNDGWFGDTPGPHQHFLQARVRAVEEGLPMVRAANTGISGVVNTYGEVQKSLELGRRGIVDGSLPPRISITLYARYGDTLFLVMLILAAVVVICVEFTIKFRRN
ncbi:MAG: apolipoprotein N-acyltransferase [Hyphomicrobiales bacterium]|nr:apolipoprotein N-acyltransferase [Hyphomicrobiales bacterium]